MSAKKRAASKKQKTAPAAKKKGTKSAKRARASRAPSGRGDRDARRPVKIAGKNIELFERDEDGPLGWLLPTMESAYTRLVPRGSIDTPPFEAAVAPAEAAPVTVAVSSLQPADATVLEPAGPTVWRDIFLEYKRRKAAAVAAPTQPGPVPGGGFAMATGAPFVPGARNWLPLGPNVVLEGQTVD
ncbi:MAG: hypothetical protein M3348_04820, partial [Acidobacteriota bacterium]|nr:hypothetical protein [Acidobacteriota bacterium]